MVSYPPLAKNYELDVNAIVFKGLPLSSNANNPFPFYA